MLLRASTCLSLKPLYILGLSLVLACLSFVEASVICSRETFGVPNYGDCTRALSVLPLDHDVRFFVEQQLRTGLPAANWDSFVDPRPSGLQNEAVQVPKLWNEGESNWGLSQHDFKHFGLFAECGTAWR